MMRPQRKKMGIFLKASALIVFLILGYYLFFSLNLKWLSVKVIDSNISQIEIAQHQKKFLNKEESKSSYIAIAYEEDKKVESIELNRSVNAQIIALVGNMQNLFEKNTNYVTYDDVNLAIISSTLSNNLYGNTNTIGLRINYKGQNYIIADVVKSSSSFFSYEAMSIQDNIIFNKLLLSSDNYEKSLQELSYDLGVELKKIDYYFLTIMLQLVYITMLTALLYKFSKVINNSYILQKYKKTVNKNKGLITIFWLTAVGYFYCITILQTIDFSPNSWADFQYYKEFFRMKIQDIAYLIDTNRSYLENQYLKRLLVLSIEITITFLLLNKIIDKEL